MEKVVCLFIDALRPDFVNEKDTPFLYKLFSENPSMDIKTILGYSDAIDATIFTGAYPDIHGYWMKYQYSPSTSPFKSPVFSPFRMIDYIPFPLVRSGVNFVLYNTFYKWYSRKVGYKDIAAFNIPYSILSYFDFTLRKTLMDEDVFSIPTIFDVLRENNRSFFYSHGVNSKVLNTLKDKDLGIIYLSDIDLSAHLFGIENSSFSETLLRIDNMIKDIFKFCKRNIPNVNILLFSDHGMAKVNNILDFRYLLKEDGFEDQYLFTLDGTMIRFWYFKERAMEKIHDLFEDKTYGHFLTEMEKRDLRIQFNHNRYGDDIFLLDQGYAIFPNFMSWSKPKAMHAYHPKYEEQRGVFMLHGKPCIDKKEIELVDIMPTILDIMELEIPSTVEGESILR